MATKLNEHGGDQRSAVATGGVFFGAHDRRRVHTCKFNELVDALAKSARPSNGVVVGFSVRRLELGVVGLPADFVAEVDVVQPAPFDRILEDLAIGVGDAAAVGDAAHVDERFDPRLAQQFDKPLSRRDAMAYGEDGCHRVLDGPSVGYRYNSAPESWNSFAFSFIPSSIASFSATANLAA